MISIINAGIKTMLGDGSAGNPYQIRTAAQLADIASKVNSADVNFNAKYYIQTADISLAAYNNWTPIGGATNRFYGVYDGNGFGIYALNTSQNRAGLFGTIENATVKNVAIVCTAGCTISTTANNTAWAGAIAAYIIGNSIISGCTNTATVINLGNAGNCFVGGIVGYANAAATFGVFDCANFGAVQQDATTTGDKFGGGICGLKGSNAVVTRCLNAGAITTTAGTILAICGFRDPTNSYYDSDTSLAGGQTGATGRTTANCQGTDALTEASKLNALGTTNWFARQGYPLPIRFNK
jgi:trimeric autotransporter adhesin